MGESPTLLRLKTAGVHCTSCTMLIDMTVGDLEGIVDSRSDYTTGITEVQYDSSIITPDEVIAAIRSVGYDAEPVE